MLLDVFFVMLCVYNAAAGNGGGGLHHFCSVVIVQLIQMAKLQTQ